MLAFHFPQYLTTPELRRSYDVGVIRQIMFWAMVMAGSLALVNIIFNRSRWLSAFAFGLVALTVMLGGHSVNVDPNFPDHTPYIGLDWFILDFLGSSRIFIFIEKKSCFRCARTSRFSGPSGRPIFTTSSSTTWWSASFC